MNRYLFVSAITSRQSPIQEFHTIQQQNEMSVHHSGTI